MNRTEHQALLRRVEALERSINMPGNMVHADLSLDDLDRRTAALMRRVEALEVELKRRRGGRPKKPIPVNEAEKAA